MEEKRQHLAEVQNAEDTIKAVLNMEERDKIFVCVPLYQWREGNNVREVERRKSPAKFAFIIQAQAQDFLKTPESPVHASREEVKRWMRPAEDALKINSDASRAWCMCPAGALQSISQNPDRKRMDINLVTW